MGRPRLGFSYDAWSSGLHGVLMFFATCSLPGVEHPEILGYRGCFRCTGDAQRSAEGPPPDRCRQALIVGVQPCPPARKCACCVNGDGRLAVPRRHGNHPEQFDGQLSVPAADARSHRSGACASGRNLALDHRQVYVTVALPENQSRRSRSTVAGTRCGGRSGN